MFSLSSPSKGSRFLLIFALLFWCCTQRNLFKRKPFPLESFSWNVCEIVSFLPRGNRFLLKDIPRFPCLFSLFFAQEETVSLWKKPLILHRILLLRSRGSRFPLKDISRFPCMFFVVLFKRKPFPFERYPLIIPRKDIFLTKRKPFPFEKNCPLYRIDYIHRGNFCKGTAHFLSRFFQKKEGHSQAFYKNLSLS